MTFEEKFKEKFELICIYHNINFQKVKKEVFEIKDKYCLDKQKVRDAIERRLKPYLKTSFNEQSDEYAIRLELQDLLKELGLDEK